MTSPTATSDPPPENEKFAPRTGKANSSKTQRPIDSTNAAGCKPFIPSWLDDLDLSQPEFRLYCHLCRRAGKDGIAWTNAETIRKVCRVSRNTVWPTIENLESRHHLIKRLGKPFGRANRYQVLVPIGPNEAPIDAPSITPNEAPLITPNEGHQSPQMERHKGYPKKVIQERLSKVINTTDEFHFSSNDLQEAWNDWQEHLSQKPKAKRPTPSALKAQYRKITAMTEREALSALNYSTEKNYQGIYQDPQFQPDAGKPGNYAEVVTYATENGLSETEAAAFYDEAEAAGWRDWSGKPIQDWRAAFRKRVSDRDKSKNHNGHKPDHRQQKAATEYPEPKVKLPRL